MTINENDVLITVCDSCHCAYCFQGEFFCENYRRAGTVQKPVSELKELGFEDPHYWQAEIDEAINGEKSDD